MYLEDTPKPDGMRIWFDVHQRHFHSLENFEEDDIEDFAGHDMMEEEEDQELLDDQTWLFPPKGPGEFAHLKNKKKKGKKGKKAKKAK